MREVIFSISYGLFQMPVLFAMLGNVGIRICSRLRCTSLSSHTTVEAGYNP